MLDRRELMKRAGMVALATGFGSLKALALDTVTLPIGNGERPLVKYPQKRPMIGLTQRPPQLETPFSIFNDGPITPNDAFFVRYHLAGVPLDIDPDKFTLEIKGKVDHPLKLSLKEIRKLHGGRTRGRQSVLRQQPRLLRSARRRRPAGQRRDGQCALARRAAEDGARQGRRAAGRQAGHLQRHGRAGDATPRRISSRRSTSTTPATAR